MFEHLPLLSKDSLTSLDTEEIGYLVEHCDELLAGLWQSNESLARAIGTCCEIAAQDIMAHPGDKELAEAEVLVAILICLRIIARTLEAQKLEAKLF